MDFMRHGQSVFNVLYESTGRDPGTVDPDLTDLGCQQVLSAAQGLARATYDLIVASPYTRALHTAAIVQDHLDLPIRVEPLIGERRLFSCDTGTPTSHLKPRWRGVDFSALTVEEWWPEADESAASLQTRLTAFHAKWGGKGARVLFVSHALFMMAATGVPAKNAQIVHLPDGE